MPFRRRGAKVVLGGSPSCPPVTESPLVRKCLCLMFKIDISVGQPEYSNQVPRAFHSRWSAPHKKLLTQDGQSYQQDTDYTLCWPDEMRLKIRKCFGISKALQSVPNTIIFNGCAYIIHQSWSENICVDIQK